MSVRAHREAKRADAAEYRERERLRKRSPEYKAKRRLRDSSPEGLAKRRVRERRWRATPEGKASRQRERSRSPERIELDRERNRHANADRAMFHMHGVDFATRALAAADRRPGSRSTRAGPGRQLYNDLVRIIRGREPTPGEYGRHRALATWA